MGVPVLLLAALLLVACFSHQTVARRLAQEQADEAASLLLLPAAATNWETATASLPGSPWLLASSAPCGTSSGDAGAAPTTWKGVSCDEQGRVTALTLSGLGLQGTLPEGLLASLPALTSLDLSGNALSGSLPLGWSSASLAVLNLSSNRVEGTLPAGWGGSEGLPVLAVMRLEGNNLTGSLPVPEWTVGGFATSATLEAQPGNAGLCGPVPPVDPRIYMPQAASAQRSGTTSLVLTQRDLFAPGTTVTITNWLGMCMTPCAETGELEQAPPWVKPAGLTWPPTVQTNAFDISFVFNMSISDLLTLNPGLAWTRTGQNLSLPCYPLEERQRLAYNGGDVAYGKFAGGNQVAGVEGLAGAMAAARVVLNLPSMPIPFRQQAPYTGSLAPGGGSNSEPRFWFVDLLAPFHVVNIVLTAGAGAPLRSALIYVGSDPTSVAANQLVASGINVEAQQQLSVPGNAAVGRYVIVYTGASSEGQMSLADVQVYTLETNTAANKPVTASALGTIDRGGAGTAFLALVDNNASTCVQLQADPSSAFDSTTAWAFVDLGYEASVASVAIAAGPATPAGTAARVYMSQRAADAPEAEAQCGGDLGLQPGGWAVGGCSLTGRYVTFAVPTASAAVLVDLCEIQVGLAVQPYLQDKDSVLFNPGGGTHGGARRSASPNGAVVAGAVLGGLLLAVLLLGGAAFGLRYRRWRRRWLHQQQQVEAALEGSKNGRDGNFISPFAQASKQQQYKEQPHGSSKEADGGASLAHCLASTGGSSAALPGAASSGDVPVIPPPPLKDSGSGGAGAGSHTGSGNRRESKQYSEWELVGEFAKTLRRSKRAQLTKAASMPGSAAANASLFQGFKSTADELERPVSADLGTLPLGIADVSPGDICLLECVGEGSYGQVWRAKFFGAIVAVKVLSKPISPTNSNVLLSGGGRGGLAGQHEELRREAAMMSTLRHPNVCRYLGACMQPPSILMEYCSRHSLDAVLAEGLSSQQASQQLSWARLLGIALDAANGMLYLHRKGIAHRDLKSANLLVDGNWQVKVADFSFSRTLQENARASSVVMTNPRWLAPEVLNGQPGQLSADVWAFGTVMWELLTWRLPFADINTFQIIARVQQQGGASLAVPPEAELPAGPLAVLPQYLELMEACRGVDPEGRPKFEAVVQQLRDIGESESRARLIAAAAAAAATAGAAAAPATQQRTVRPAPRGPAYAAMAAMLKQRQECMERAAFGSSGLAAPFGGSGRGSGALAAPPAAAVAASSPAPSSAALPSHAPSL